MRRNNGATLLIIFVIIALLLSSFGIYASERSENEISARSGALYELSSGRFLYSKNMNERLYMASTTKIATALVVIESLPLDKTVKIPREAVGTEGSSAYFKEGEQITVEGLLFALLLRSANDAAVALAIEAAGSVEAFALMMNAKAEELGLADTNFTNPHGLHDPLHYTTAHDLALFTAQALKNDTFSNIVKQKKHVVKTDVTTHVFVNHNKLLSRYDGAIGVKTGFTKNAGRCLVGAAQKDGVTLISVTLDAPDDWNDHEELFDLGFSLVENRVIATKKDFNYTLPVLNSTDGKTVTVAPLSEVRAVLLKNESAPNAEVYLPRYLTAPIELGDTVGEVVFKDGEKTVAKVPLTVTQSVDSVPKKHFFQKIKDIFIKRKTGTDE